MEKEIATKKILHKCLQILFIIIMLKDRIQIQVNRPQINFKWNVGP